MEHNNLKEDSPPYEHKVFLKVYAGVIGELTMQIKYLGYWHCQTRAQTIIVKAYQLQKYYKMLLAVCAREKQFQLNKYCTPLFGPVAPKHPHIDNCIVIYNRMR